LSETPPADADKEAVKEKPAYELEREGNIARNNKLLSDLGLEGGMKSLLEKSLALEKEKETDKYEWYLLQNAILMRVSGQLKQQALLLLWM
jgi:hypothetical protein